MLIRLGGFWDVVLYTFVGRSRFPDHLPFSWFAGGGGMKIRKPVGLRIGVSEMERDYFLAGVLWVVLVPESTEVLVLARESRMVRLMEVSMKQMAE